MNWREALDRADLESLTEAQKRLVADLVNDMAAAICADVKDRPRLTRRFEEMQECLEAEDPALANAAVFVLLALLEHDNARRLSSL